jgi:DNA polymerase I-like protein with 3'-5' exonuclease and polymerase domains
MIVYTLDKFKELTANWQCPIALDTETHPSTILGISMAPVLRLNAPGGINEVGGACYLPIAHWEANVGAFKSILSPILKDYLCDWLSRQDLIGHNFTYDKEQIDKYFQIDSKWIADTRIMAHLAAAPAGPRPYGLKDLQVEILGWEGRGDIELEAHVKAKGGSLKKGDHYLADLEILAKYACLDALATAQLCAKLKDFFNIHDYWWMLDKIMSYQLLLEYNTKQGIRVDVAGLEKINERLLSRKELYKKQVNEELKDDIHSLERDWADRRIAEYKREHNKVRYANDPSKWEKFNFNSDAHKRELFFEKLHNTPTAYTEGGKPSVDSDSIRQLSGTFVEPYLKYEKVNTLSSNFTGPYLGALVDGKLHPRFNICGTVSYRLSGFKPYLLNAPFDEKEIMRNLLCDEGYTGIHADLSAIEPTITAHYSEDPSLLKVFRDGKGDIYLDLALELFPNNKELQDGYNPNIPITKKVKEKYSKERKISKVIQLAVQYTGTGSTVAKNLSKDGIPTTRDEADNYVRAYWKKFRKVAEFNYRLKELNRKQGYIRNIIGRIIRVPNPEYKDLSNRVIQSSAHDVLILWVEEIYRQARIKNIPIKPILLDCHDSTSNQAPTEHKESLKRVYADALSEINNQLDLCVTIKADIKEFHTLAGLKNSEE